MIPRLFHWVWLGPNLLPPRDQKWMRSWREKHPSWRCILWAERPELLDVSDEALPDFEVRPLPPLVNRKAYDSIEKWITGRAAVAARSDIVRCEIIARYGGVYLDTDVECFKDITMLLEGVRVFVSDGEGGQPCNYLFGAVPNHPALWTAVRELERHLASGSHSGDPVLATGPKYLSPCLHSAPELVIYPFQLFNPLHPEVNPTLVTQWPPCSYGNHHFDGKWHDGVKNKSLPPEFRSNFSTQNQGEHHDSQTVPVGLARP